ncbi:unnamed protein product, partial [Gulo gulo]
TDKNREGREAPGSLTQQNFRGKQEKVPIQVRWAGGTVGKVENACVQRKAVHSFDEGPHGSLAGFQAPRTPPETASQI